MNIPNALAAIERGLLSLQEATAALTETAPDRVVVRAGENLQAALDRGGSIDLDAAIWEGTYTIPSNTSLTGRPGTKIHGKTGPALLIAPGTHHVAVSQLEATSAARQVIEIGENDRGQTSLDQVPTDILLTDVIVPRHRGKRAFAVHGARVQLLNCATRDCYDVGEEESHGVYIVNTNGPVKIRGGAYSAGSVIIMMGGDTTRIPHAQPVVLIDGVTVYRPLAEQHDGVYRKPKGAIEAKNAKITIRNSRIDGVWTGGGQQAEAFVFTPDLDGGRQLPPLQSGQVEALVEDCEVINCGTLANIRGRSYNSYTPAATTVTFRRVTARLSRAKFGGRGQLATIAGEPTSVVFEQMDVEQDGSSLIYYEFGDVIDPDTKLLRIAGRLGRLALTGSRCTLGEYGIMLAGYTNARNWQESVSVLDVRGNAFAGSTAMRAALPDNTYA